MPKKRIRFDLDETNGIDVEAEFKRTYGGSEANWSWLQRTLGRIDPDDLRERCQTIGEEDPVTRLLLSPCVIYGQIELGDETAWNAGLIDGSFLIEAVVHIDYEREYYRQRREMIPPREQNV